MYKVQQGEHDDRERVADLSYILYTLARLARRCRECEQARKR